MGLLSNFNWSRRNEGNKGNVILLTLHSLLDYFCYFFYFCGTKDSGDGSAEHCLLVPQIAAPHFVPLGRRNEGNKGNVILLTMDSLLDYFCDFLSFCGTKKFTAGQNRIICGLN